MKNKTKKLMRSLFSPEDLELESRSSKNYSCSLRIYSCIAWGRKNSPWDIQPVDDVTDKVAKLLDDNNQKRR